MNKFTDIKICILVILAAAILVLVVILVMKFHYRKVMTKKNCAIVRLMREQMQLEKENEIITTENAVLHKYLEMAITGIVETGHCVETG
ncbi:hypothetical protein LJC73_04605, partial [Bacteroidales bacterium OttesenSCG-928-L14]|nr:hypothetical protein [Bacteroidales bacterium OttesenSCG-928-L14]